VKGTYVSRTEKVAIATQLTKLLFPQIKVISLHCVMVMAAVNGILAFG